MILGDIFVLRVFCRIDIPGLNAQNALNVLHYRASAQVGAGATELEVATKFSMDVNATYKGLIVNDATFWGVSCQKIEPLPVGDQFVTIVDRGIGSDLGEVLPTTTCGILTKRTGLAGRRNRGRVYVPFMGEGQNEPTGVPTAAYRVALGALAFLLVSPFVVVVGANQLACQPVIYHKGLLPRTSDLTQIEVRPYWATQRRRSTARRPDPPPFA